ncbi:hypothetical protein ThvES_00006400 [Thiovulum sp. ES]|nr:hypothetical protein ThvES_00006400 [Thiovulum sp. ES]
MKIVLSDRIHVNKGNFRSLLKAIQKFDYFHSTKYEEYKKIHGNYRNFKNEKELEFIYKDLEVLSKKELFEKELDNFILSKAEMLSFLITLPNWYSEEISSNTEFIFEKAFYENKEDLLLNIASAKFWVLFWKELFQNDKDITHAILFSGGLTYGQALIYVTKDIGVPLFLVEHFFYWK